jgi:hypothetical protein
MNEDALHPACGGNEAGLERHQVIALDEHVFRLLPRVSGYVGNISFSTSKGDFVDWRSGAESRAQLI